MPFLGALAGAIISGVGAAATAVGAAGIGASLTAAGAGLGAAGLGTAIGGMTLSGLATGAMYVGTAMQVIGGVTGSKTLSKIGMGFSVAGGLGGLASAGATAARGMGTRGLLSNAVKVDGMTGATTASQQAASKAFDAGSMSRGAKAIGTTRLNPVKSAATIGSQVSGGSSVDDARFDPEFERNYFQRGNNMLTQYNPMMGVLGGMGDAYMANETNEVRKDLLDRELAFKQQEVDLQKAAFDRSVANSGPMAAYTPLNLVRDPNAFTPLLRGPR